MHSTDAPHTDSRTLAGDVATLTDGAAHQRAWAPEGMPEDSVPYFGFVEALSAQGGMSGWVAGLVPHEPVKLTLLAGGIEIARTTARHTRSDIWRNNQVDYLTGFAFELEAMLPLLGQPELSLSESISVCIADTFYGLALARPWNVGDVMALLQAHQADSTPDTSISHLPPHLALDRLTHRANRLLMRPRRTDRAQCVGTIEQIGLLPGEYVILGGWWSKNQARAASAVLISGQQKSAVGLLAYTVPRPDLDADHCGFIALARVQGGLQLTEAQPQFTLSLGEAQSTWLNSMRGMRVLAPEAAVAELARIATEQTKDIGQAEALVAFARELSPWVRSSQMEELGVSIGIDAFYLAPGFGVLLSGWVVSPLGTLTDLAVQIGSGTCLLDPQTLSLSARPDLGQAFPHMADRVRYAGFAAVLRGATTLDASRKWLLRLKFSDQSTVFFDVPKDRARRIDGDFDIAPLADARFGLADAPWLHEFIDVVYGQHAEPEGLERQESFTADDSVIIQNLPETRHGLILALDRIANLADQFEPHGLLLLLPKNAPVGLVQTWLRKIKKTTPALRVVVSRLPAGANAWQALPSLLRRLGIRRFGFVGPEVILTRTGAIAMANCLQEDPQRPTFLAIEHLVGGTHAKLSRESQAFAWTSSKFLAFRERSISLVGGLSERNGMDAMKDCVDLPSLNGPHALRLRALQPNTFAGNLNRRLLEQG